MPRSQCDFCCAPEELARNVDTYRAAHLQVLCAELDTSLLGNEILNDILIQLQSGGTSGTQYIEGTVVPLVTGTAIMWRDAGNVMEPVSATTPLPVNIVAGSSSGVQYTDGDVDATVTGTAIMWKDAGNVITSVSAATPLPVTFSGNVTVDQGTSPWVVSGTVAATQSGAWTVAATQSGTWNINNISGTISLPTGAATSALQTSGNASLTSIDSKTPALGQALAAASVPVVLTAAQLTTLTPLSSVTVSGTVAATQSGTWNIATVSAVTAITNALPAGTNLLGKVGIDQTTPGTTNAVSIAQIGANTVLTGNGVTGTGSQRVTIASDNIAFSVNAIQSGTWNINNISGTISLPTGAATSALQTSGNASLTSIDSKTPALGQALAAASVPVVLTASQLSTLTPLSSVTVSGTVTANAGTGTFQENIAQINGVTPLMGNGVTGTGSLRVTIASDNTAFSVNAAQSGTWNVASITSSIVPGTGATNLGKAEDSVAASGDTGVGMLGVINNTNASKAADGDYTFHSLDDSGMARMVGNVANDAADAGDPVKIGFQARQTFPTAVADADRVNAIADDAGRQVVVLNSVRDLTTDQGTTVSNTTETTIVTAVASTFNDLVLLVMTNTSSTSVRADIRDVTAGTVRFSVNLPARGGAVIPFNSPLKQATVNTAWTIQLSAAVTDVRILAQVVQNK